MTTMCKHGFLLMTGLLLLAGASLAPMATAQGRMSAERQKAQFETMFSALGDSLALTDEQRPQVRSILEKEQERRMELMQSMRQGQGGREGLRTRMQELDAETAEALSAILTGEQMEKYATVRMNARQSGQRAARRGGRSNPQDLN